MSCAYLHVVDALVEQPLAVAIELQAPQACPAYEHARMSRCLILHALESGVPATILYPDCAAVRSSNNAGIGSQASSEHFFTKTALSASIVIYTPQGIHVLQYCCVDMGNML